MIIEYSEVDESRVRWNRGGEWKSADIEELIAAYEWKQSIPRHGDLIDRDALMAHKGSAYDIDGHELYAVGTGTILRMPAVIPAERSEE